jgi:hypothetical protein
MGLTHHFLFRKMSELYVYSDEKGQMNLTNNKMMFWSSDLEMVEIYGLENIPIDLKATLVTSLLESILPYNKRFVGWKVSGPSDTFYFEKSNGTNQDLPASLPLMDKAEIESILEKFRSNPINENIYRPMPPLQ